MINLSELLKEAVFRRASDLHLAVGIPPCLRIDGRLVRMNRSVLTAEECEALARQILGQEAWDSFLQSGEYDLAYSVPELSRFRCNIFRQRGTMSLALRTIPFGIPEVDSLNLPAVTEEILNGPQGLILVTGPTGSGKSTTLAAMVDLMNRSMERHIITLEDPIEYLHSHRKSIVVQREIGLDTASFSTGLRSALREDPDVILIGEMRDLETISIAITAAETGHLVLASLHTPGAVQTIDRIVDVFPTTQQPQIRLQLSSVLVAVLAQRLLPHKSGQGRVAAFEVLLNTPAVANLIRTEKVYQIQSAVQTGAQYGMQTMEQAIGQLVRKGELDQLDAERLLIERRSL